MTLEKVTSNKDFALRNDKNSFIKPKNYGNSIWPSHLKDQYFWAKQRWNCWSQENTCTTSSFCWRPTREAMHSGTLMFVQTKAISLDIVESFIVNGRSRLEIRFGSHRTQQMLGHNAPKVWPVSTYTQQHPTTHKNTEQVSTCHTNGRKTLWTQQCCVLLANTVLRPVAFKFKRSS